MKKEELSKLLLYGWANIDQAGFDKLIEEALTNIPVKLQLKFIDYIADDIKENPHNWNDDAKYVKEWLTKVEKLKGTWI